MDVKQVLTIELTTEQLVALIATAVRKALNGKNEQEEELFLSRAKVVNILDCSYSYLDKSGLKKYKNKKGSISRYKKSEVMAFLKTFDER